MHLRGASVVSIAANAATGPAGQVSVRLGTRSCTLTLQPASVRGEDYSLWEQRDDGWHRVDPAAERTFRGTVQNLPGSVVAGGLVDNGVLARVILPDGGEYWIEPLADHIAGARQGDHVVYSLDNLVDADWRCGNTEMPLGKVVHDGEGGGQPRDVTLYTAQLATDADWEYFQRWGGTVRVADRIAAIINTMNVQYERDTNITHVIAMSLVRTTAADPYTTSDPATLNSQVQTEWNSLSGTRDVIQLFTGRDIDGSVIGRANHIGAICTAGGDPNCYVQSDFNGNFMSAVDLSAHELGHLWAAVHCSCSNPASTMNPVITSVNRFTFSNDQDNIGQIVAYRNSRPCLTSGSGTSPRNDNCASAVPISDGRFGFNNIGAATDGPAASCGTVGADVWFRLTAPCNGSVTVDTCNNANETGFDTVLVAYSGGCSSLTELACNDDDQGCSASLRRSRISFDVSRNASYLIRVGGYQGATGEGILNISTSYSCPPAPSNDACASPITISECDGVITTSNFGATTDGPVEVPLCTGAGSSTISSDIWYRYVAPCAGTVRVSSCGSSLDTKIAVYTSCPTGPNQAIACNDDDGPACAGTSASVDFAAATGAAYLIRLGSYSNIAQGELSLSIHDLACPIPPNDSCAGATSVFVGSNTFSNVNACNDGANGCGSGLSAVFYRFTAPSSCTYTIDTCNAANFDTLLAVYAACADTSPLACNDDSCGTQSSVTFQAVLGDTYIVRVHGFGGAQGGGQLHITQGPPINDVCTGAIPIGLGTTLVDNRCAASETVAGCGSGTSVYYSFLSPVTCRLNIDTCDTARTFDTILAVHADCDPGRFITCNDDTCGRGSRVALDAVANTTYIIRVSGFLGATGTALLRIGPANDECADAEALAPGTTTVNINGATQSGQPIGCGTPHADVWFTYTAPANGSVTVDTCGAGTNFDTILSAYDGSACPVSQARQLACNDDFCAPASSSITFNVASGYAYTLRLASYFDILCGSADLTLRFTAATCPCNFNGDAFLNSQDFFDFITAFFSQNPTADYNHDGFINSQDFFDFVTCFFSPPATCP